jgi:hypothetical protein
LGEMQIYHCRFLITRSKGHPRPLSYTLPYSNSKCNLGEVTEKPNLGLKQYLFKENTFESFAKPTSTL